MLEKIEFYKAVNCFFVCFVTDIMTTVQKCSTLCVCTCVCTQKGRNSEL